MDISDIAQLDAEQIRAAATSDQFEDEGLTQTALARLSNLAHADGHDMLEVMLAILANEPEEIACEHHGALATLAEKPIRGDSGERAILEAASAVLKSVADWMNSGGEASEDD